MSPEAGSERQVQPGPLWAAGFPCPRVHLLTSVSCLPLAFPELSASDDSSLSDGPLREEGEARLRDNSQGWAPSALGLRQSSGARGLGEAGCHSRWVLVPLGPAHAHREWGWPALPMRVTQPFGQGRAGRVAAGTQASWGFISVCTCRSQRAVCLATAARLLERRVAGHESVDQEPCLQTLRMPGEGDRAGVPSCPGECPG